MKGNQQLYSSRKAERIKGYKKLIKKQGDYYKPSKEIARNLIEAMAAMGYDVSLEQATAYLTSSYAVHDRDYYVKHYRLSRKENG